MSLRSMLLIATAIGCSRALPIAPAQESNKPGSNKPGSVLAVGSYKLTVSSTHEISCSMSFESSSDYTTHQLSIAADGNASLTVKTHRRSIFGPSESKFKGGASTKEDSSREAKYACHAQSVEGATRVECVEEKTSGKATLSCRPASVEVTAGAKKVRLDAVACGGLPWLPIEAVEYFKGPPPLGVDGGVLLDIESYGHGSDHVSLRKGY